MRKNVKRVDNNKQVRSHRRHHTNMCVCVRARGVLSVRIKKLFEDEDKKKTINMKHDFVLVCSINCC